MKKNLFVFFVGFMILSIVGVVFLQGYWIYSAWKDKDEEFTLAVKQSIKTVANEIQKREIIDYISTYEHLRDSLGTPEDSHFTDIFFFVGEDNLRSLPSFYAYGILEENYNIDPAYLDPKLGEISNIKSYKGVKTTVLNKSTLNRENKGFSSFKKTKSVDKISLFDHAKYRSLFTDYSKTVPIHMRFDINELDYLLKKEFENKNITIPYRFGVYDNGLSTKIKSNDYEEEELGAKYSMPLFVNENEDVRYKLVVSFPEKNSFIFSSIIGIGGLTLFLTLFIVLVSSGAIYQIIRQKKISEIKTDFINNMSHEFKTPIATINLALDAIANPRTQKNPQQTEQYLRLIREENERMLTQIENILRISQLEKSSHPIQKEPIHLHSLVREAIDHVRLITENRQGKIRLELNADNDLFSGNQSHFTNAIINILDNAIKYSESAPEIEITTKNDNSNLILIVKDKGIGMGVAVQKKIFERFYREQSGNIHNTKGHGLGLAYVKRIVDLHQGKIMIDSKRGRGTNFSIILRLSPTQNRSL